MLRFYVNASGKSDYDMSMYDHVYLIAWELQLTYVFYCQADLCTNFLFDAFRSFICIFFVRFVAMVLIFKSAWLMVTFWQKDNKNID